MSRVSVVTMATLHRHRGNILFLHLSVVVVVFLKQNIVRVLFLEFKLGRGGGEGIKIFINLFIYF